MSCSKPPSTPSPPSLLDDEGEDRSVRKGGYLDIRRDRPIGPRMTRERRTSLGVMKPLSKGAIIDTSRERLVASGPVNDNEGLVSGSERGKSIMLGSNLTRACNEKDNDDSLVIMNSPLHKKKGAEAEEICQSDEEFTLSESGERIAASEAREGIEEAILAKEPDPKEGEQGLFTPIEAVAGPVQAIQIQRKPKRHEADLESRLREVGSLLQQNTLEAHDEALVILEDAKVLAAQRYQAIHTNPDPEEKHNFSEVSPRRVNHFTRTVLEELDLNDKSMIYVLGSGFCNDDLHFARNSRAHVVCVDKAPTGIVAAKHHLETVDKKGELKWVEKALRAVADNHGRPYNETRGFLNELIAQDKCTAKMIRRRGRFGPTEYRREVADIIGMMNSARDRVQFVEDDYLNVLESSGGMGIDAIFSHSTLHYFPPPSFLRSEFSP